MRRWWMLPLVLGCAPEDPVYAPKGEDVAVETDTDGTGSVRPPGPNADEYGKVSAWLQLVDTVQTSSSPECVETTGDWADIFRPPQYEADGNYYVFYRVGTGGTTAQNQNCGGGFPDGCTDREPLFAVSDHVVEGFQINTPEDLEGDCSLSVDNLVRVTDRGDFGLLEIGPVITYTESCPADVATNNGCLVTHSFDVEWVRAE